MHLRPAAWTTAVAALVATPTYAHVDADPLHSLWSFDPFVIGGLLLASGLYVLGIAQRHRRHTSAGLHAWPIAAFAAGLAALVFALVWPLDALSTVSFAAHMGQHMLLITVAPILLVLGAPLASWAALTPVRPVVTGLGRASALARPSLAFGLHSATLWAWHAPGPFQAALNSQALHTLEHVTLLATALLLWWSLLRSGRARAAGYGVSAVLALAMILHTGVLGALLTLAPRVLYPAYGERAATLGLAPLEDQQLAGLLMWIPGGLFYLIVGLGLAAAWLKHSERRARVFEVAGTRQP